MFVCRCLNRKPTGKVVWQPSPVETTSEMSVCRVRDRVQSRLEYSCTCFTPGLTLAFFTEPAPFGGAAVV